VQGRYDHRQVFPLAALVGLVGLAGGAAALVLLLRDGFPGVGTVMGFGWAAFIFAIGFDSAFLYVRVVDRGKALSVELGPMGLRQGQVSYSKMASAERASIDELERWQVRRGGPVRVYGATRGPAVRILLKKPPGARLPRAVFIGTNDADGLLAFLRRRIGEAGD
jgi:hypothetical protein